MEKKGVKFVKHSIKDNTFYASHNIAFIRNKKNKTWNLLLVDMACDRINWWNFI